MKYHLVTAGLLIGAYAAYAAGLTTESVILIGLGMIAEGAFIARVARQARGKFNSGRK